MSIRTRTSGIMIPAYVVPVAPPGCVGGTPIVFGNPNDLSAQPPWSVFGWTSGGGAQPDADGGNSAWLNIVNGGPNASMWQTQTLAGNTTYRLVAYFKRGVGTYTLVFFGMYSLDFSTDFSGARFDIANGVVDSSFTAGTGIFDCADIDNTGLQPGWYKCVAQGSFSVGADFHITILFGTANNDSLYTYNVNA